MHRACIHRLIWLFLQISMSLREYRWRQSCEGSELGTEDVFVFFMFWQLQSGVHPWSEETGDIINQFVTCHLVCRHHHQEQSSLCLHLPSLRSPWLHLHHRWPGLMHPAAQMKCISTDAVLTRGSQLHCKHICTHTENYLSCCQVRLEIKYWQVARISFWIKLP